MHLVSVLALPQGRVFFTPSDRATSAVSANPDFLLSKLGKGKAEIGQVFK